MLKGELRFLFCPSTSHEGLANSSYPRNAVPVELFRKEPNNNNSALWETCLDCRNLGAQRTKNTKQRMIDKIESVGGKSCSTCCKEINKEIEVYNRNGKLSKLCSNCKIASKNRTKMLQDIYKKIKMEFIMTFQVSCQLCQCLYFKPQNESLIVDIYKTYLKEDGKRYMTFSGIEYLVSFVLENCSHLLEISIIELDHLSKEEQLERGLIKSFDEYIPKKKGVNQLHSEDAIRLEARKCQNLCMKCHVTTTINREGGWKTHINGTILEQQKAKYIIDLKSKGCISCGFKDEKLHRFLEMDHLEDKIDSISAMVRNENISFEALIEETKKCRVLCRHCHKIHTMKQKEKGILSLKIKSDKEK